MADADPVTPPEPADAPDSAVAIPRRLVVVGEICVDIIVAVGDAALRFGQHEQLVPSTTLTMGSSSVITATGAAALGVATTMVGVRGDDEFGRYMQRELARRGVDTSRVRIETGVPTGSSTHLTRPDGDRAILTAMGSIGRTRADDVDDALLAQAAHLHGGSYFLQEQLWPLAADLFARARDAGASTSLDGNFDPGGRWDSGILDVLPYVDVFFGNEQEITGIAKTPTLPEAVTAILDRMPDGATVVCKLGGDGARAVWRDEGSIRSVTAEVPAIDGGLVDTVGAGDTLAAGYLAALVDGADRSGCLALGVACGSLSTRAAGGVDGQPSGSVARGVAARVVVAAD